ncbi:MAG: hypothetical protein V1870_04835 [Candidatus Aenigmatarchaeota archaeon]
MIVGLSSFDTAADLPFAIDQVAHALKDDGVFLHIQDVRPGTNCVLNYLRRCNQSSPNFGYVYNNDLFGLVTDDGVRDTIDIFKDAMHDAISTCPLLDLVDNSYYTFTESGCNEFYYFNFHGTLSGNGHTRDTTVLVTLAKKKMK